MERRRFLQTALAMPALAAMPSTVRSAVAAEQSEGWRTYEIVTKVEIDFPDGVSRAWVPLPLPRTTDWQRPLGNKWTGNGQMRVEKDPKYGAEMLYAEWKPNTADAVVEVTSRFQTRDRAVDLSRPNPNAPKLSSAQFKFETAPTELIPTDGIVHETALDITKGAKTDVEKARAIYEWIVANTYREPTVRGCGWGDIKSMLETRNFGGKCGDLNALFVGLARSVDVPSRDVYGVRVAPSQFGYKSMGLGSPSATKGQHCRAEFFAQGFGWVPVDPADVRKVILEEPPGKLALSDPKVEAMHKKLFGAWEMNWLAYNNAHDLKLPHSSGSKISYLMYTNGEAGGKVLDQLDPDTFKYSITAKQITA
jgi:transglutaminase-like putative cysteine protease